MQSAPLLYPTPGFWRITVINWFCNNNCYTCFRFLAIPIVFYKERRTVFRGFLILLFRFGIPDRNHGRERQPVFSFPRSGGNDLWLLCAVHRAAYQLPAWSCRHKGTQRLQNYMSVFFYYRQNVFLSNSIAFLPFCFKNQITNNFPDAVMIETLLAFLKIYSFLP